MILHGKPNEVVADVCDVGKSIGVKVDVECSNIIGVFSKGKGEGDKRSERWLGGQWAEGEGGGVGGRCMRVVSWRLCGWVWGGGVLMKLLSYNVRGLGG